MTWATSVPILVFLGLSVLKLGPMYATDRQTSDRRQTKTSLNASALLGRRHNKKQLKTRTEELGKRKRLPVPNSFKLRSASLCIFGCPAAR